MVSVTLQDQIKCVMREISMRMAVYPKLVTRGKMNGDVADRELSTMKAVLKTLQGLVDDGK